MKKIALLTAVFISLTAAYAQDAPTTTAPAKVETSITGHAIPIAEQHRIFAYLGMGYSNSMYNGVNNDFIHRNYSLSSVLEVKYAYFFTPQWGLSLGAGLSYFTAKGTMNTEGIISHYNDPYFDPGNNGRFYDLHYRTDDLVERQHIWALEVPLLGQFEHFFTDKYGILAGLGLRGYFPFISARSVFPHGEGSLTTAGYEDFTNGSYIDDPHFGKRNARATAAPASLRISLDIVAEFGGLLRLSPVYDLYVGLYGSYGFMDVLPKDKKDFISAEPNNSFAVNSLLASGVLGDYNRFIRTNHLNWKEVGEKWNRWQIGVKVGLHIKPCKISKTPKAKSLRDSQREFYDRMPEAVSNAGKTVILRDTIQVVYIQPVALENYKEEDALTQAEKESINALVELLNDNKVLFDLNSDVPKMEDRSFIPEVIKILKKAPTLSMLVEGYTCDLGTEEHNRDLAARRATAIRKLFLQQGADPAQVQIAAYTAGDPESRLNIKSPDREEHRAVIFRLIKECK
jgi:outer membrane protein OmpA-like peptidoglycan-associated protein